MASGNFGFRIMIYMCRRTATWRKVGDLQQSAGVAIRKADDQIIKACKAYSRTDIAKPQGSTLAQSWRHEECR